MNTHDLDNLPPGYRPVMWSEVRHGEQVMLQHRCDEMLGPYWVVDHISHQLRNTAGEGFTHDGETLLYKKGPLVVVYATGSRLHGVYSDVPLEIYAPNERGGDASRRPLDIAGMPKALREQLDEAAPVGWPAMFGVWSVKSVSPEDTPPPEIEQVTLHITSRITANALCSELLRHQFAFSCRPVLNDAFIFYMSREALRHVTQHMRRLLPDELVHVL